MIVKAKLVKIYCSRDLLPTDVGGHITPNVVMLQYYCSRHLKISSFLSVQDWGTREERNHSWLVGHMFCTPWILTQWFSDSSVYTGKFLPITIPFINRFIEIYFIDQKIAHLGYFYEWSVSKCLGCTPSPRPGRNIISSPTKHYSCSSPALFSPDFYLWATTGLISPPHHDGLHSSPDRSRFPFSAVSSSVYLLI